jgi:hypothetical protein
MEDGFDFLGFNSRHYDGKLLIKQTTWKTSSTYTNRVTSRYIKSQSNLA